MQRSNKDCKEKCRNRPHINIWLNVMVFVVRSLINPYSLSLYIYPTHVRSFDCCTDEHTRHEHPLAAICSILNTHFHIFIVRNRSLVLDEKLWDNLILLVWYFLRCQLFCSIVWLLQILRTHVVVVVVSTLAKNEWKQETKKEEQTTTMKALSSCCLSYYHYYYYDMPELVHREKERERHEHRPSSISILGTGSNCLCSFIRCWHARRKLGFKEPYNLSLKFRFSSATFSFLYKI